MGMLSTVINALAVQDLLERKGVATRVMTAIRMEEVAEPVYPPASPATHGERTGRYFCRWYWHPYFSTDTAAVLRAIEMSSDVVIKATKVKGVYSADPVQDPSAEFIPEITFQEVVTRELGVMDAAAVSLCKENGLPIIVLNLENRGAVSAPFVESRSAPWFHRLRFEMARGSGSREHTQKGGYVVEASQVTNGRCH